MLLGWGKEFRLVELIEKIGTPEEHLLLQYPVNLPSDYREYNKASREEIDAFVKYGAWLQKMRRKLQDASKLSL